MKSFTDIEKQVLSHVHVEYGEDIRPTRDWLLLLSCAGILLLVSVLFNVWTFARVVNGEIVGGVTTTAPQVDTNAIDAVQKVFEDRTSEELNYKGAYHFVDPSR